MGGADADADLRRPPVGQANRLQPLAMTPPPLTDLVLQVQGLCFAYPGAAPLFDRWQAALPAGLTWLAGDTGSGKTTLLRLLAGDLAPEPGRDGQRRLAGVVCERDPAAYRRQVSWFDPRDPAWDALTPAGLMAAQRQQHAGLDEAAWQRPLAGFDLLAHLAKPLYALSTGSRRKAALAVALASGARLTLLDEPTGGLDAAALAYLGQALVEAAAAPGRALLLASSQGPQAVPGAPAGGLITLPDREF